MKYRLKIFLVTTLFVLSFSACKTKTDNIVTIKQGVLQGQAEDGVSSFLGIPYAKPPVGELRWRAPQEPDSWSGIRFADNFGPDPMQPAGQGPFAAKEKPSEDCLYLNVWRPENVTGKPLPVMVWIYGGGWMSGGSSFSLYNGQAIARRGVIVVSFNYRVGRLGFFAHPALSKEHPDEPKGNYGLLDQIAALKWVHDNIEAFGGDPKNITIFGESAGGGSVEAMLQSPLASGLFHKAISQSSGPTGVQTGRIIDKDLPGRPSAESFGLAFAKAKGIEGDDDAVLKQLRALPAEQLINLAEGLPGESDTSNVKWGGPMLDGKVLVKQEYKAYTAGHFNKVPIITGATSGDLPGPIVNGKIDGVGTTIESAVARFAPYQDEVLQAFDPENRENVMEIAYKSGSAWFMIEPARFVSSVFSEHGLPVYQYRFSYIKESMKDRWLYGTPHAHELPFLFSTLGSFFGNDITPVDQEVSDKMIAYWTNFAKKGNPNGDGLKDWPRYSKATDLILDFQPDGSIKSGPDPLKKQLDVVEKAAEGRSF